jgi:hypothetical protein
MANAALQSIDATIHAAMLGAGLADLGTYLAPGGNPSTDTIACRVFVDRNTQELGDFGQLVGSRDVVGLFKADVQSPLQGASVTIGSETLKLKSLLDQDESKQRWVVSHV